MAPFTADFYLPKRLSTARAQRYLVGVWQDQHGAEHGGVRGLVGLAGDARCPESVNLQRLEAPNQERIGIVWSLTMVKHHERW